MEYGAAVILGIIQGLTEFLPVSSTAHLAVAQNFLQLPQDQFGLTFDVALHIGTAIAVLIYFWQTWFRLLANSFKRGTAASQSIDRRLLLAIAVGTLPAGIFGLLLEDAIETAFRSPLVIVGSLLVGSALFYYAEKIGKRNRMLEDIKVGNGFLIGCSQAIALIPGISRSGITISAALFQNFDREAAARFAFLLSTPVIFGAGLKKFIDITFLNPVPINWSLFGVGFLTSLIVGYITIVYFLKYLRTHSLSAFIWYRVVLAVIILALVFANQLSI